MRLPAYKNSKGFTLIELLVVITIISALAVVVFVALNPAGRLQQSRDAKRATDVESLLTAVHEYIVDNAGDYPTGMSAGMAEAQLGTAATGCAVATGGCVVTATACLDLSTDLAAYLKTMPVDPYTGTDPETNYSVVVDSNGIVTIRSCGVEVLTELHSSR